MKFNKLEYQNELESYTMDELHEEGDRLTEEGDKKIEEMNSLTEDIENYSESDYELEKMKDVLKQCHNEIDIITEKVSILTNILKERKSPRIYH